MGKFAHALALLLTLCLAAPVLAGPYEDGVVAANKGDYASALRLWRPLADQGNSAAQNNLGVMYDNGRGVPQDCTDVRCRVSIQHILGTP